MKKYLLLFLLALSATLPVHAAQKPQNFVEVYQQTCAFVTNEIYGDDWCNIGNATGLTPNVVLLGDSYSNSAVGMLDEYALLGRKGILYEQYARGQCPTLLDYGPDWCSAFAQTVYDRIKNTPSIQTVVLAANWSAYWAEQKEYSPSVAKRPYLRAEFEKSFQATVEAYQSLGKKVVVMYRSPSIADPRVCVSRLIQPVGVASLCTLSREQAEKSEEYRQFLNPLLLQLKVKSFDPYAYFCNAKECKLKDGEKIFMTTATHLSGFGGQYLARKAAPELKKLLQF